MFVFLSRDCCYCGIGSRFYAFLVVNWICFFDLVHGTWVRDQRVEPHACVEVEEGDTIRIGGSTRIYRLHWIPLSRAYDFDNPFVSPLDASTVMEQEEENRMIEADNLEVAQHQVRPSPMCFLCVVFEIFF